MAARNTAGTVFATAPIGAKVFGLVPDFHCRTGVYGNPCRHTLVDTCTPADKLEKSKNGFKSEWFEGRARFDEGNAPVAAQNRFADSSTAPSYAGTVPVILVSADGRGGGGPEKRAIGAAGASASAWGCASWKSRASRASQTAGISRLTPPGRVHGVDGLRASGRPRRREVVRIGIASDVPGTSERVFSSCSRPGQRRMRQRERSLVEFFGWRERFENREDREAARAPDRDRTCPGAPGSGTYWGQTRARSSRNPRGRCGDRLGADENGRGAGAKSARSWVRSCGRGPSRSADETVRGQ